MSKLFLFAYPQEAEPFLKHYDAKHLFHLKNIQYLFSETHNVYFIITGSENSSVSVALSIFFEKYTNLKNNITCFNIGIAGSFQKPLYHIFYASKITNYHNLKSFYPEVFIKSDYAELMSIQFPADKKIMSQYPHHLFDMEGYTFATTAKYFVKNHQIHFIKFISDNDGQIKNSFELLDEYEKQTPSFIDIINTISREIEKFFYRDTHQIINAEEYINKISDNLSLTYSQKQQLLKSSFFFLRNNPLENLKSVFREFENNTISSKQQRNKYFQSILKTLYNV